MLPIEDRDLISQTMMGLNVDEATTSSLLGSFDLAAESLEGDPVAAVAEASFGDSHTGGYRLATNARMAHEAISDELLKMAAGMRGMGQSYGMFADDVVDTTEQTTATMNLVKASTECISAPVFDSGSCSLPNDSKD